MADIVDRLLELCVGLNGEALPDDRPLLLAPLAGDVKEAAAEIEHLRTTLSTAIIRSLEAKNEAREWQGKYIAAGYPSTLDGWTDRAAKAEAALARTRNAALGEAASAVDTVFKWVNRHEFSGTKSINAAMRGAALFALGEATDAIRALKEGGE